MLWPQEQIHHYRTTTLDRGDSSGKWSKEWIAARNRQVVDFLKR
jgi:hypothetical protein